MKHTHSTSWIILGADVGLMDKLGVRIVSPILAMPRESLFEPRFSSIK